MEKIEKRLVEIEVALENTFKILTEHNKIFETTSEKFEGQEKMITDLLKLNSKALESIAVTQEDLVAALNQNQKDIAEIYENLNTIYDLLNLNR